MKSYRLLTIPVIILSLMTGTAYGHGIHPHPKIKVKAPKVKLGFKGTEVLGFRRPLHYYGYS